MTWVPLLVVAAVILWLRFRVSERAVSSIDAGVRATLVAHGTRRLFNGQPARAAYQVRPNRAARRRERHIRRKA
jgi:hypothetical protein